MANSFGTLFIGKSGLVSAQNALNTTANNLANVNTDGYVRQQVRFADTNYTNIKQPTVYTNIAQTGLGVSIGDVVHARDVFLDKSYRLEAGRCDFYTELYNVTTYIEDLMQELDGEEFKESISDLWDSFQELAKAPGDSTNQNLVIQKAQLLVNRTSALYSDLKSYQSNINTQISDEIDRVNEIGNRIYEINLEVQKVEAGGVETAMTLRDERDSLLDELATYVSIDITEDQTGFTYVEIEGTPFIDDNRCYNIELLKDNKTGFYTPYWPQLSNVDQKEYVNVFRTDVDIDAEYNNDVGSIKSLLLSRGDGYGHYYDLQDEESYEGISKSILMETEAQVELLYNSIITTMNDLFCPNVSFADTTGIDVFTYFGATTQVDDYGVSYVEVTADDGTTLKLTADTQILDVDNATVGSDGELPPEELFTRSGVERYTQLTVGGQTYYVYNAPDRTQGESLYNITNVVVNEDLTKQVTLLPCWKQDGAVSYDLGTKISEAWENQCMTLNPGDTSPCTFERFYDRIIDNLGILGNTYKAAEDTMEDTVSSIDNSRSQVTGVSSDEELTKLIKFQAAYNASSRFMTVVSEMTELIVTGLI